MKENTENSFPRGVACREWRAATAEIYPDLIYLISTVEKKKDLICRVGYWWNFIAVKGGEGKTIRGQQGAGMLTDIVSGSILGRLSLACSLSSTGGNSSALFWKHRQIRFPLFLLPRTYNFQRNSSRNARRPGYREWETGYYCLKSMLGNVFILFCFLSLSTSGLPPT